MKFVLLGLLVIAGVLFAAPTIYSDSPQPSVQCVSPAPVPELAIGYGGSWGILNAVNDLSYVEPGYQASTYTDTAQPLGVYIVNPESSDINILAYYKDLQRNVDIKGRPLYYQPPAGASQWLHICYLQPGQALTVPAGTKLLVPVVISIPGNVTLDKPTYLALEFAQAEEGNLLFRQQAFFTISPTPASSSPVIFMAFAGGLCVVVIAVYLFTLKRRRAR